ncbi:RNA polymerase sigma factor [Deltaproteobacteria bacterium]|nr:RNA polymerase sigma factor [Deltaproteobacteria bacterium]
MEDFETFYNRQHGKLFSYLLRITGDYDLSMDIMQEAFTRYLEKYAKDTRSVSLLYTIARNGFMDYKRMSVRNPVLEQDQEDPSENQGEMLQIKQEYRQVLAAMKKLADDEREILALVTAGDLRYREIASLVGTTEANVKVKVHRARVKLRKILKTGDLS